MKKLLLLLITVVCQQVVSAQQLPKIIPPSPQSQEFFKHLDYPPGNSSGAVNYSIPIYEVKSGSLSLPISIGYMSGGSKVSDMPGDVGYGWTLNAGGRISRTIYGKPDEGSTFPDEMKSINSGSEANVNYDYVASLYQSIQGYSALPIHDSEYDIYSYSFGGNSGKFIYNEYESKVYTIPEKPYRVDGIAGDLTWTIVDDKGITYKYNTTESASVPAGSMGSFPTSKQLNYIISADKRDTISITYQQLANQANISSLSTSVIHDNFTSDEIFSHVLPAPSWITQGSTNEVNFNYVVFTVQEIRFRGGKVVFTANSANDGIEYIKVYDNKGQLIKQVQLTRASGNLTGVRFKDIAGTDQEKYAFEYYPGNRGDYQADLYGYLKYDGGHVPQQSVSWRFYDDDNHFLGGTPTVYGSFLSGPSVSYASTTDSQIGMLKKITYPTGGTAEYTYALNQVLGGGPGEVINSGGMRLAAVTLTDNNGGVHCRTYRYGNGIGVGGDENGYGFKQLVMPANLNYPAYISYEMRVFPWMYPNPTGEPLLSTSSYRRRVYTSSFLPQIAEAAAESTFYPVVTVYEGTPGSNIGKTVYGYNTNASGSKYSVQPYPDYGSDPYFPASTVSTFYNIYYNKYPIHYDYSLSSKYHIQQFDHWRSNPLETTVVYKVDALGNYYPVKKVANNYNFVQTNSFKGMHVVRNALTTEGGGYYEGTADSHAALDFKVPIFLYNNYYVTTGREDLTSTTETLYTPTGNVVTTTSYEYNSNNQVNKVTRTESGGDSKITTYKYAVDQSTTEPYRSMVIKNMLAPVIEEATYKNAVNSGNFLQSTRTDYAFWANNIAVAKTPDVDPDPNPIYPERVWTQKNNPSNSDLRLWYKSYGMYDGNVQEVHEKWTGPATSYIWGYNRQYPIAQAINSSINNIFHENFEEGAGNSTHNSSHTGHYSKTDAYTKALTGLTNGKYALRYWKKTGGVWAMQTSLVTVTGTAYTINIAVSAGELLDDVCFYPESAQMVTLTYDPLIGMTSSTDNQGVTTYYEYDSYQRLINVKDKDGKIFKHMDYQYKQ